MHILTPYLALLATLVSYPAAGPNRYAICQVGCASAVIACYSAAGATSEAILSLGAPLSILYCNASFGK